VATYSRKRQQGEGAPERYTFIGIRQNDGAIIYIEASATMTTFRGRQSSVALYRDITERKWMETELHKSMEKYRTIVDNINDAIIIHDFEGNIVDCNEQAYKMLGYNLEDLLGENLSKFDAPHYAEKMPDRISRIHQQGGLVFDSEQVHHDGRRIPVSVNARVVSNTGKGAILAIIRDLTEYKKSQENVQKVERLESLGVLAAGIAHDFNNLLCGIFGYIDLARGRSGVEEIREDLRKALDTMDRARQLTGKLLTFAKGGAPMLKSAALFPFIDDVVRAAVKGTKVTIECTVPPDLWHSAYDPDQMRQVITELAESCAGDETITQIAGYVSRQMLRHYSHIRMEAKRTALDAALDARKKRRNRST